MLSALRWSRSSALVRNTGTCVAPMRDGHEVALVAGKDFAVRVGEDRGDEAELAQRQLDQVETLGNRRPWVVGRWSNGVDGFEGDVHSPRRLRISLSTLSLSKPASCFTRSHHAMNSSWVMRNR